jgi:hypothetical protein
MTEPQQLIDKYQSTNDDDEKSDIIEEDFDVLTDNSKWNFLLPLLADSETYDLVKVNVYKIIETADFTDLDVEDIKNKILEALEDEEDEMVRQYGFMALTWNFSDFSDVIDFCMLTVEDEEEDENVRHCAFGVLTKSKDIKKIDSLRERLLKTKGIKKYALTFFNDRVKGNR